MTSEEVWKVDLGGGEAMDIGGGETQPLPPPQGGGVGITSLDAAAAGGAGLDIALCRAGCCVARPSSPPPPKSHKKFERELVVMRDQK